MKQIILMAISVALAFSMQNAHAQMKKPPKVPIIIKGGGTPPYNPIPPIIIFDLTPASESKGFSGFTISASQQKEANSILEMKSKTVYKHGFAANINEKQYNFYDNGKYPDKKAGDGIYTTTLDKKYQIPGGQNSGPKGSSTNTGRFVIETVKCPPDCKSLIFQTTCTVCFHIKWESK